LQKQTWTVKDILIWTSNFFNEKDIDAPRITSELLLGKALGLTRINLYLNYDRPLSETELKLYKSYINRRISGEPTQYITGTQEFWSLNFRVTPDVLIPRSDTETLVEAVVNDIRASGRKDVSILEIGTGSGIISVAIAHELKGGAKVKITAVDISENALKIAKENATYNTVDDRIEFILSDKFENINGDEKFDYILSNPPYIAKEYYDQLEAKVKDFEPKLALYGGEDGLSFYTGFFCDADKRLTDGGKIYLEIDFRKKDALEGLLDKQKYSNINYHKDLAGHERVLGLTKGR